MKSFAATLLLAALALPACSLYPEASVPSAEVDVELLAQHWVHSREEERPESGGQIYRPAGFRQFPPSWFRMQYVFHEEGACEWLYLAPNDAHHFRPGTWWFDRDEEDVLHIAEGDRTVSYRIVELTPDLLRLIQLAPADGEAAQRVGR